MVADWAELAERRAEVAGKIVVIAMEWEGYSITNEYRGASSALVRGWPEQPLHWRPAAKRCHRLADQSCSHVAAFPQVAAFGGVASLIRSPASFSIASPHTGSGGYMQDRVGLITADSSFGLEHP